MSLFCLASDPQCENDSAIDVLSNIYGYDFIHAFFTSGSYPAEIAPTSIAPIILGGLANVAGMLAIVVFICLILTSLLNSAQDGEAFGKGSAKSVIFLRFLFSFSLLFPTASGYCVAQIILMTFVLWSNGETNKLYNNVVMKSAIQDIDYSSKSATVSDDIDAFGVRGFALGHFQQAYCLNLLNANYSPVGSIPTPVTKGNYSVLSGTGNISTAYVPQNTNAFGPIISEFIPTDPSDVKNGGYRAIKLVDKSGQVALPSAAVCGSLLVNEIPKNTQDTSLTKSKYGLGMSLDEQRAIYAAIANGATKIAEAKKTILLQTTAEISEWMVSANIPYDLNSPDYSTQLNSVDFNDLRSTIIDMQLKGNQEFKFVVEGLDLRSLTKQLTDSLTAKGWTHAAGIKQRIIASQSSFVRAVGADVVSMTPPDYSVLQNDDGRLQRFKAATEAMNVVVEQTLGKAAFAKYSDSELIARAIPSEASEDVSAKQVNSELRNRYSTMIGEAKRGIVHLLITGEYTADTPEAALSNGMTSDWLNTEYDVLGNIQKTGEYLSILNSSFSIMLGVGKTAVISAYGVTGASSTIQSIFEAILFEIIHVIEPLIKKLLMYMVILEPYMSVVLPSMPYFFFITGVVAWYIHILQAMAGLPFWAIMHMIPERSFVGSQTQGYITVIALFLRPMLTLTGLFFAFILANSILLYVTDAFFSMQDNMLTTSAGNNLFRYVAEMTTFFNWLIIYCTLMLQVCYMIFGLAGTLPDTVLRWLGSGLNSGGWGESNAREALSAGAGASVADNKQTAANRANSGGGNGGGGNGGNGGGANSGGNGGGGNGGGGNGGANPNQNVTPTSGGVDDNFAMKQQGSSTPAAGTSSFGGTSGSSGGISGNTTPILSKAAQDFKSVGGQVNANGDAKSFTELHKENKDRSSQSRGGFYTQSLIGGVSGGVTGAAMGASSGIKSAIAGASQQSGLANKFKAASSGFGTGFSGHTSAGFKTGATVAAQNHYAEKGGVADGQGGFSSGSANKVSASQFANAYRGLNKAPK